MLLRVATWEVARRRDTLPQLSDDALAELARDAAAQASIRAHERLGELEDPTGLGTWLSKFAILEVAVMCRRLAWQGRELPAGRECASLLPGLPALTQAIEDELTPRQRQVVLSVALAEVPLDVLAERLGATRGALYGTLQAARRILRRHIPAPPCGAGDSPR